MSKPDTPYRKRAIGDRPLSPETLMMSYGFDAKLSEGSIKPPVFLTSTFAFATAESFCRYLVTRQMMRLLMSYKPSFRIGKSSVFQLPTWSGGWGHSTA